MTKPLRFAALLFAFGATAANLEPTAAAPRVVTIDSLHIWQASLEIDKNAHWDGIAAIMHIAPTTTSEGVYSPHDLADAWRELDHMLPPRFITTVSDHASKTGCLEGADPQTISMHNSLSGFIYDDWIAPKGAQFGDFLQQHFDHSTQSSVSGGTFEREAGIFAAAWTLCTYYNWKHDHNPSDAEILSESLRSEVARLREGGR